MQGRYRIYENSKHPIFKKNLYMFAKTFLLLLAGLQFFSASAQVSTSLKLPTVFSDNMVLQQGIRTGVWGTGKAASNVVVSLSGKSVKGKVQPDGKWNLKLPVMKAGGPFDLKISSDGESLVYHNVMIGEVWICSGQSNMEMPLAGWGKIKNYEEEISKANYPAIRLFQVQHATSKTPLEDVKADGGKWQVCEPATIDKFSATAYFFARTVYEKTHVAIGLIHTSWGGTIAEAWTSGGSLKTMADFAPAVEKMEAAAKQDAGVVTTPIKAQLEAWTKAFQAKDRGYTFTEASWAAPDLVTAEWKNMKLPVFWEQAGLPEFDGIVWFRKTVNIPASFAGASVKLSLGTIDDDDVTYINGIEVGRSEGYAKPRNYTLPANTMHEGVNTLTVRVVDNAGGGGFYGEEKDLFLQNSAGEKISLAGSWNYRVSASMKDLPVKPVADEGPNRVTVLYNAMIHPLIGYGIKGAIWYQGESNAGRAYQYRTLFPLMISDWRKQWGQGNFPFYFVQLANFTDTKPEPAPSDWAELREAQQKTLSLPATGMAVIIDIGEAKDIHPKNKQDVGKRLGLIALNKTYGVKVPCSGPTFSSFTTEGRQIKVKFNDVYTGLAAADGQSLKGFAVAGEDQKFYWADAKIEGSQVVVSSSEVAKPVAVRYGWASNPVLNLVNKEGLPASPFRSDDWKMVTRK